MRISVFAPLATPIATPEYMAEYARVAEDCGFHGLWAPEHGVLFDECKPKYSPDGKGFAMDASGIRAALEPVAEALIDAMAD